MYRKVIFIIITIIACFLLQSTLLQKIALASVVPNLMIIVTSSFGFMMGRKAGILTGFFSGLMVDLIFGQVLGVYALIYLLIGLANGYFQRIFYPEDIKRPLVMICISDIACNILTWFIFFLFRGKYDLLSYMKAVILPEFIYTLIAAIFLYMLLLQIYKALDEAQKRSAKKFV